MAIVHQIAVNPLCKVEDLRRQCPHSKLHETVKNDMQKAFWDLLRDDLSKNPPDKKNAFSLIVDLKNVSFFSFILSRFKYTPFSFDKFICH